MPDTPLTGQDDARRALADEFRAMAARRREQAEEDRPPNFRARCLGAAAAYEEAARMVTALRASPERAAEEMRETIAQWHETEGVKAERQQLQMRSLADASSKKIYRAKAMQHMDCAAAIRALRADPLPQETGESDE